MVAKTIHSFAKSDETTCNFIRCHTVVKSIKISISVHLFGEILKRIIFMIYKSRLREFGNIFTKKLCRFHLSKTYQIEIYKRQFRDDNLEGN